MLIIDDLLVEFPSISDLLKTYGMIAFQFDIHPMLMTIQVDMQDKKKIGLVVTYGILSEFASSS